MAILMGVLAITAMATWLMLGSSASPSNSQRGIGIGALALGGLAVSWLAGYLIHRAIEARKPALAQTVADVLGRAQLVDNLSQSLALDVEKLIETCNSLDQSMLAKTLGLMLGEYNSAVASEDRQAALMKAVELMDKLHHKLAPWYVKHQILLTWGVGLVGAALSAAKTIGEILSVLHE